MTQPDIISIRTPMRFSDLYARDLSGLMRQFHAELKEHPGLTRKIMDATSPAQLQQAVGDFVGTHEGHWEGMKSRIENGGRLIDMDISSFGAAASVVRLAVEAFVKERGGEILKGQQCIAMGKG
jgi:hypothetical protein